jgi:hypothetical protein
MKRKERQALVRRVRCTGKGPMRKVDGNRQSVGDVRYALLCTISPQAILLFSRFIPLHVGADDSPHSSNCSRSRCSSSTNDVMVSLCKAAHRAAPPQKPHFSFPLFSRQHPLVLAHPKLSRTSTHSLTASSKHGCLLDTTACLQVSPRPLRPAHSSANAPSQDHHRPCGCCVGGRLWRHHQLEPICLLQELRLHDEDLPAALAPLDGVPDHKAQVCDPTRSLLLLPIRQRA